MGSLNSILVFSFRFLNLVHEWFSMTIQRDMGCSGESIGEGLECYSPPPPYNLKEYTKTQCIDTKMH